MSENVLYSLHENEKKKKKKKKISHVNWNKRMMDSISREH